MVYYGDFPTSHTAVCMPFDSFAASTGAPSATSNFAAADIVIFKDGSATERTSAAGITVTTSFNTSTGLQMVVIDLSDNTDSGFYAAGHEYSVAVADVTIDSQTVRFWLGSFSIERAGGALEKLKSATFGLSALKTLIDTLDDFVDTEVAAIKTKTDFLPSATAGAAGGLFIAGTNAATTITTALTTTFTGNLTGSVGSVTGAVGSVTGAVGSVTGAVGSVTGNVGGNVTGSVGSVTGLTASNLDAAVSSRAVAGDAMTLTAGERAATADTILARSLAAQSYAADGAVPTLSQCLYLIQQSIGDFSISGTTLTVNKLDGTTAAATYTLDDAVTPTSRTRAT